MSCLSPLQSLKQDMQKMKALKKKNKSISFEKSSSAIVKWLLERLHKIIYIDLLYIYIVTDHTDLY